MMKVNDLNVSEPRTTQYIIPPEENMIGFFLGEKDVYALTSLQRGWQCNMPDQTLEKVIRKAIEERHSLKGYTLTLTKTGRHVNQGTIWLEKELRKEVIKEAAKLEMSTADYIRGIIYSLNEKLGLEQKAKYEHESKIRHDNRKIPVQLWLDKELREKLFKRFEKELNDEELREKLERRHVRWNGAISKDQMLQEVLVNHLLKYLNE